MGKDPPKRGKTPWPAPRHTRRMLVLDAVSTGCDAECECLCGTCSGLSISLVTAPEAGCCGAVAYLNDQAGGLDAMQANIDAYG